MFSICSNLRKISIFSKKILPKHFRVELEGGLTLLNSHFVFEDRLSMSEGCAYRFGPLLVNLSERWVISMSSSGVYVECGLKIWPLNRVINGQPAKRHLNAINIECWLGSFETGLSPPVKYMYLLTVPRRFFVCGSFMLFLSCVCYAICARLLIYALWSSAGKGLTSWLSFVVSNCAFGTFPLVSWVKCGT